MPTQITLSLMARSLTIPRLGPPNVDQLDDADGHPEWANLILRSVRGRFAGANNERATIGPVSAPQLNRFAPAGDKRRPGLLHRKTSHQTILAPPAKKPRDIFGLNL